jgi:hypothetical protein
MASEDATAPVKNPRSEAQVASLEKARAKARELRESRNVIRQQHGITDETEETPTDDAETENAETENAETESSSASENEDEEPKAAVVEKKEKPLKKEKPKTDPAPKPKPQAKPQPKEDHVQIPQNFRMMSRNLYILFEE